MPKKLDKVIVLGVLVSFIFSLVQAPVFAQVDPMPWMPKPGVMVSLSAEFTPAYLKGIVIHPENPFKFDFIIYRGDKALTYTQKKEEYTKLTKYFLASLAIPDDDQWVNLSPYEKDRMIKDDFGKTEMGRDLLAQDYLLKQITASLIYPQESLGKKFWDKVYAQANKQYGTTNIPVKTFNKVWIVPDSALIYEKGNMAYVVKHHLKIMLEEDYLSLEKHSGVSTVIPSSSAHSIASKIIKEIILPELQREVNEDANFAPLRQVYSGTILAAWFKRELRASLLARIYDNKSKVRGIDQDPRANDQIYQRYLQAYKKGVFNFIKEDTDRLTNETIPRKYFSGGTVVDGSVFADEATITHDPAMALLDIETNRSNLDVVGTEMDRVREGAMNTPERAQGTEDKAMADFSNVDLSTESVQGRINRELTSLRSHLDEWPDSFQFVRGYLDALKQIQHKEGFPKDSFISLLNYFWHKRILVGTSVMWIGDLGGARRILNEAKENTDEMSERTKALLESRTNDFWQEVLDYVRHDIRIGDIASARTLVNASYKYNDRGVFGLQFDELKSFLKGKRVRVAKAKNTFNNWGEIGGVYLFDWRWKDGKRRYIFLGNTGDNELSKPSLNPEVPDNMLPEPFAYRDQNGNLRLNERIKASLRYLDFLEARVYFIGDDGRIHEDQLNELERKTVDSVRDIFFVENSSLHPKIFRISYHVNNGRRFFKAAGQELRFFIEHNFNKLQTFLAGDPDLLHTLNYIPFDQDIYFGTVLLPHYESQNLILKEGRVIIESSQDKIKFELFRQGDDIFIQSEGQESQKIDLKRGYDIPLPTLNGPPHGGEKRRLTLSSWAEDKYHISVLNQAYYPVILTYQKPNSAMSSQVPVLKSKYSGIESSRDAAMNGNDKARVPQIQFLKLVDAFVPSTDPQRKSLDGKAEILAGRAYNALDVLAVSRYLLNHLAADIGPDQWYSTHYQLNIYYNPGSDYEELIASILIDIAISLNLNAYFTVEFNHHHFIRFYNFKFENRHEERQHLFALLGTIRTQLETRSFLPVMPSHSISFGKIRTSLHPWDSLDFDEVGNLKATSGSVKAPAIDGLDLPVLRRVQGFVDAIRTLQEALQHSYGFEEVSREHSQNHMYTVGRNTTVVFTRKGPLTHGARWALNHFLTKVLGQIVTIVNRRYDPSLPVGEGRIDFRIKIPMETIKEKLEPYVNEVLNPTVNPAMLHKRGGQLPFGGIDMNAANLNLDIKRDGNGMPIFSQQDLAQISNGLEGLNPVIISIEPASQTKLFSQLIGKY